MIEWLPPEGLSLLTAWLLVAFSFATSFITAAFGIGGGVLMLGVIATVLPPAAVIPVHGLVQLGSNAGRTILMLKDVARALAWPFLIGSTLGAALGALVVVELPTALWQTALGLFILWSAWGRMPAFRGRGALVVTGFVSTFLSMFFGATGPFIAGMLKTLRLDRLVHVATHAACMTAQHLLKVLAFGAVGFAFADYAPLVASMIVSGFVGTWVGRRVLAGRENARFHLVLSVILSLLALRLVWSGLAAFAAQHQ
jgi:uncharacterized membrane protein YfcA